MSGILRVICSAAVCMALSLSAESTSRFCSWSRIPTARSRSEVFFLGTARLDTVPVSAGELTPDTSELRGGRPVPDAMYGQLVSVERVGRPWASLLPSGKTEVILVPWDNTAGCEPAFWRQSARWSPPGTRAVYRAKLRSPRFWTGGRPTLDVIGPGHAPYVARREREIAQESRRFEVQIHTPSQQHGPLRVLTEVEFLELVEALPLEDSLESAPESLSVVLEAWARSHPSLLRAWPATDVYRYANRRVADARVRQLHSPFAGTFRITVVFGTGQSTVLYARTGSRPRSSIRETSPESASRDLPVLAYYLKAKFAASPTDIPPDDRGPEGGWVAASLQPFQVDGDSSLWRGSLDPLVEAAKLDSRPFVQLHARSLFGVDERLRDRSWFYTPGVWVLHRDGRLTYQYDVRSGATPVYSVRAERVSTQALGRWRH